MISFRGRLATIPFAVLAALFVAACQGDSATGPRSDRRNLRLEAASATQLEGTVGEPVNAVPTVIVRNGSGRPVPGVEVLFAPLNDPHDSVGTFNAITDSRGVASPGNWILATSVGRHELIATLQTAHFSANDCVAGDAICFRVEAQPGPPVAIRGEVSDSVAFPGDQVDLPNIWVTDRFGNFTSRTPTTITLSVASGGGSVSTTTKIWTLGPGPGVNSIVASAPGLDSATFNVRALDVGAITRYDLSSLPDNVVSGSIALGETGVFELNTVLIDAWGGSDRYRTFGTYALTGTKIVLTYAPGVTEEGTLTGDTLSVLRGGSLPQAWTFVKRP